MIEGGLELPPAGSAEVSVAGRRLRLTSLDKVLFPAAGFTKAQLIEYYAAVAGALLPHLAGRPLTLGRFPDGVDAPGFAQTECRGRPEWVRTKTLRLRGGEVRNFCLLEDLPGLLWAANLGTIELHPYLGAGEQGEDAVLVVFDLDPAPGAEALAAAQVALALRAALERVDLAACAKTSGGAGLHVYAPLNQPHEYEAVRAFAAQVAGRLASEHPDLVTTETAVAERGPRVRIDWLQNHPRRSTIAPYSLRAAARPTVSAPLAWPELEAAVASARGEALRFTPEQVVRRVREQGDLFAPVLEVTRRLPGAPG